MPDFLALSDPQCPTCRRLSAFSQKIATLLLAREKSRTGILAFLDDLLGAVYNLFFAVHHGYADRPQPLTRHDIENVVIRAKDMANCKIRTEGKWTAGVYFNNALFRVAGVYHRALKIAAGRPDTREFPHELMPDVQKSYRAMKGSAWKHTNADAIYREVNGLKHTPKGVAEGRTVRFAQAVEAVQEILALIDALS